LRRFFRLARLARASFLWREISSCTSANSSRGFGLITKLRNRFSFDEETFALL